MRVTIRNKYGQYVGSYRDGRLEVEQGWYPEERKQSLKLLAALWKLYRRDAEAWKEAMLYTGSREMVQR